MFAGIDIAAERHMLARLDAEGRPIGKPIAISEDREGHETLLRALGAPPVLVAVEATGDYRKNLFAALTAAGHQLAPLNPPPARRFQHASLEPQDGRDRRNRARASASRGPAPTRTHDEASEVLRELSAIATGCAGSRRSGPPAGSPGRSRLPESTGYVRSLEACSPLSAAEYPTAHALARATPAAERLRYDGRHLVFDESPDN